MTFRKTDSQICAVKVRKVLIQTRIHFAEKHNSPLTEDLTNHVLSRADPPLFLGKPGNYIQIRELNEWRHRSYDTARQTDPGRDP